MPAKKDEPKAPILVKEREERRAGGGAFWVERVRPLGDGEALPDGAQVVEGEPYDWRPALEA